MIRKWICILAAILLLPVTGIAENSPMEKTLFYTWKEYREALAGLHSMTPEFGEWYMPFMLDPRIYAFFEGGQEEEVFSFLIIGSERSILWDTGMGIGKLRERVEDLACTPVTVLNSHEHPDHIGGNSEFDEIWCYNDAAAVKRLTDGYDHQFLIDHFALNPEDITLPLPKGFDLSTYSIAGKAPTGTVEDGQVIDLGDVSLEVIHTPGHTPASIMLLDEEDAVLFAGDSFYEGPIYLCFPGSSLEDYVASMKKAAARISGDNRNWMIYGSHNEIPLLSNRQRFLETARFAEAILNGEITEYRVNEDGYREYQMDESISFWLPNE